ncbi:PIN domain-containing protein [Kangiella shandongensis]|uniref:PIN domain-containing protein n=1 Tax=Kangiella shandongensis TaxID=2763258 RepID=UPI001CBF5D6C|nr:hypothetical protein [Kangiella shandongensis]
MNNNIDKKEVSGGSISIKQTHNGDGYNIGQLNINQTVELAPSALKKSVQEVLNSAKNGDVEASLNSIATLQRLPNDYDSEVYLKALKVRLQIVDGKVPNDAYGELSSALVSGEIKDEKVIDLCSSVLIRIDIVREDIESAIKRFRSSQYPGLETCCAYYHLASTSEELKDYYNEVQAVADINILESVFLGSIRVDDLEFAKVVLERYRKHDESEYFVKLKLLLDHQILFKEASHISSWLMSFEHKKKLEENKKTLLNLLDGKKKPGGILLHITIGICLSESFSEKSLLEVCLQYIEVVKKYSDEAYEALKSHKGESSGRYALIKDLGENPKLQKKALASIKPGSRVSEHEMIVLLQFASEIDAKLHLESGTQINSSDNAVAEFYNLILLSKIVSLENNQYRVELINRVDKFVELAGNNITQFNLSWVMDISELCLRNNLAIAAFKILNPFILGKSLWLSPIVRQFLQCAYYSDQYETLSNTLSRLHISEWDSLVWSIDFALKRKSGSDKEAISSILNAIECDDSQPSNWFNYIHLIKELRGDNEVRDIIKQIPQQALENSLSFDIKLLVLLNNLGYYKITEDVACKLFKKNPNKYARNITDVHFYSLPYNHNSEAENNGDSAYRFLLDGKEKNKIISDDITAESKRFYITKSSNLGKILSRLNYDDEEYLNGQKVILIEKVPVYVQILRYSIYIRVELNDGSDTFFIFESPGNQDELISHLKDKIHYFESNRKSIKLLPDQIPLYLKGRFLNKSNPVLGCLDSMLDKLEVNYKFHNFGDEDSKQIVLDIYSVFYMAISGLIEGIDFENTKFYITKETNTFIEYWINDIDDRDHLSLNTTTDGDLIKIDYEVRQLQWLSVKNYMLLLMKHINIIHPKKKDIPNEILSIKDIVDESVYSTIVVASTNDLHWLAIDSTFSQLSQHINVKVINAYRYFINLNLNVDFSTLKNGIYYHAYTCFPYALTPSNLVSLLLSKDKYDLNTLASIFRRFPKILLSYNKPLKTIADMMCSGRLNPNTLLSGSITLNKEVFNGKKKTTSVIQSGV